MGQESSGLGDQAGQGVQPDGGIAEPAGRAEACELPDRLAEQWDGTNWSFESTPNPVGTLPSLNGVSCSSPGICTAVGSFKTFSGTTETLAERLT